ncbi:MAG: hypothetical protein KGH63_03730, partial [Candidatus Micrarchaeota archaeon]|nr:hypothetical protein [Candidatus Micrarchaeota archaeon]
ATERRAPASGPIPANARASASFGPAPFAAPPAPASRRGILFTLSVLLLGFSLLSMAFFLSSQSAKSSGTAAALSDIDRTSSAFSNMEDEIAVILSPSIQVSVVNGTASINESLPLSTRLPSDLDAFGQFEGNYSDQNITMNLTGLKSGNLVIQPVGAAVAQAPGSFNITPPSSAGVKSYYVELVYPSGGVDSASWIAVSNSSNNTMDVHVRVRDVQYAVLLDYDYALDRGGTSILNISNAGAPAGQITFSSPAALSISTGGAIDLKTSVGFSTPVDVESNDVLTVQSAANKSGPIRIG